MPGKFVLRDVCAVDLAESPHPISTGVGFLDHMIDQFNSHAQIGVGVTVLRSGGEDGGEGMDSTDKNRWSEPPEDQADLMATAGEGLGAAIRALIDPLRKGGGGGTGASRTSRFCCPLDEALVECALSVVDGGDGELTDFTLPPYGIYPSPSGRTRIGRMSTVHLRHFFASLARTSGLRVSLRKIRGDNGHHVVESAFKAFSRSLRNLLDGTDTRDEEGGGGGGGSGFEELWGPDSESRRRGSELCRSATSERSTKETSISVSLRLDGGGAKGGAAVSVDTGVPALDSLLSALATEAEWSLDVKCRGDTWVDDHHTSEDVAIAVGKCLDEALGTKAGLNRMWCAGGTSGDAEVEVTMDLSNRPQLTHDLFSSSSSSSGGGGEEYIAVGEEKGEGEPLSVEMFVHVLDSLVVNGGMTVHVVSLKPEEAPATAAETAAATAKAFGRALRMCAAVDPRRQGRTASSKGTLSA